MGDGMKSIKAGTQVLGVDNCMDVLSLTEEMKVGREACLGGMMHSVLTC